MFTCSGPSIFNHSHNRTAWFVHSGTVTLSHYNQNVHVFFITCICVGLGGLKVCLFVCLFVCFVRGIFSHQGHTIHNKRGTSD